VTGDGAVICGVGSWLPPVLVTNADLAARLDTSDEWIRTRTGIRQRYVVPPGMATGDLAVEAGRAALKSAGVDAVDAVIVATTTPDRPCPATAPSVAARLGLGGVAAFDVGAVCTGFLYALAAGAGLIASSFAERVLVLGSDTFSTILDPADRSTMAVFGDGAGGVVLRRGGAGVPGALGPFVLGSDGAQVDLITVRAGGSSQRSTGHPPGPGEAFFTMAGREVFAAAVQRMASASRQALDTAGWTVGDLDVLVAHQANLRILRAVADDLELDPDRMIVDLDRTANTAAASIPLALDQANASGRLRAGDRVLLTAFGGGATWGATTLVWPDVDAA